MAIGRLLHYTIDAVLVSTVLAGVRRSSGFTYVLHLMFAEMNMLITIGSGLQTCNAQHRR